MAKSDWKAPFLEFRDQIRPLFDSGVKLYHGILMSPFHERDEIKEVVKNQAAADLGQSLAFSVDTPTDDCKYHAHYFYGDNSTCLLLAEALSGVDDWIRDVPKGLLPILNFQCRKSSRDVMAVWANLVYCLAWECDPPYLQATVEYQSRVHEVSSHEWYFGSWPENCDPRPILIQQGDPRGRFGNLLESFTDEQWCPDIIGAYLRGEPFCGDLIGASLAAVDVLVFMLEQIRGQETEESKKLTTSAKMKLQSRSRRISNEIILLRELLEERHNFEIHGQKARIPLTAEQIAIAMEWYSESGKPLQARVSRRMAEYYRTKNGMEKYRRLFIRGLPPKGTFNKNPDGTSAIDGYVGDEKDLVDEEKDLYENDLD